jgi:hypothetical protein
MVVSSILLLVLEALSTLVVVVASSEVASMLVKPQVESPSHHAAWPIPWPLEPSVKVVPISHPLPVLHAVFMTPSLILECDVAVHQVAQGLVLTCLQSLAKTMVKAS